jgi:hypothetical protein
MSPAYKSVNENVHRGVRFMDVANSGRIDWRELLCIFLALIDEAAKR